MRISWTDIDRACAALFFAITLANFYGGDEWRISALIAVMFMLNGVMNSVSAMRVEITVDGETVDSSEAS